MNYRRLPFQFSSTDPVERQSELEKRFGLNSKKNMYVDVANPLSSMDAEVGSPRRQHRVPIFMDGFDQPINTSVDSVSSVDAEKKSKVRVVPIEIEGADSGPFSRRRTFSGPSRIVKEKENALPSESLLYPKLSSQDAFNKLKQASGPRVHSIPVKIERRNSTKSPVKQDKTATSNVKDKVKSNGCAASTQASESKCDKKEKTDPVPEPIVESPIEISLRKINEVLKDFVSYEAGVKEFTGTVKDKQYRYLDEMLTRCMLRLDDVDTLGNEEVRSARKNAIKKVQASVDLLETKINASTEQKSDVQADAEVSPSEQVAEDSNLTFESNGVIDGEVIDTKEEIVETTEPILKAPEGDSFDMKEANADKMDDNMQIVVNSPDKPVDIPHSQAELLTESGNLVNRNIVISDSKDMPGTSEIAMTGNSTDESIDNIQSQQTDIPSADAKSADLIDPQINVCDSKNETSEIEMLDATQETDIIPEQNIDQDVDMEDVSDSLVSDINSTNELVTDPKVSNSSDCNSKFISTEL